MRERGRALALFFGIVGGLTAIGPILGGYLTEWTWRAIFLVNIPVALIALALIVISKPTTAHAPARMDDRGLALIGAGVALSVFGFQQSSSWGWSNPATGLAIAAGVVLLVVFYVVEKRTDSPLINVSIFDNRAFRVENLVLAISMLAFVPVFFLASEDAQISLGKSAKQASLVLLYFSSVSRPPPRSAAACSTGRGQASGGARLRPRRGGVHALGWKRHRPQLRLADLVHHHVRRRARVDARTSQHRCGEPRVAVVLWRSHRHHTDRAQLLVEPRPGHPRHDPGLSERHHVTTSLTAQGMPAAQAAEQATSIAQSSQGGGGSGSTIPHFIALDFAYATRTALYSMAIIMAAAGVVALFGCGAGSRWRPPQQPQWRRQPDPLAPDRADYPRTASNSAR